MDIVVLKFGGSSLATNERLKLVAEKILNHKKENTHIVAILSAQGKTTNKLIEEANELSNNCQKRELDMLLSTGEQISCAKLAILLNDMGNNTISLTGWQAGIYTDTISQNAAIESISTNRILSELKKENIVLITGFQGIDENMNITTLRKRRFGHNCTSCGCSSKY